MSWKEISPGHFARPLDTMEDMFVKYGGRAHSVNREAWSINCAIPFRIVGGSSDSSKPEAVVERLRQAWKAMRYTYPELASTVQESDMTKRYVAARSDADVDAWLAATFSVEREGRSVDDIIAASSSIERLARLYYLPSSSTLLFRSQHWRLDGMGTVGFMDRFFDAVAAPPRDTALAFGNEGKNLAPSMEEVAGVSLTAPATKEQLASVDALMKYWVGVLPPCGFPSTPEQRARTPGPPAYTRMPPLDAGTSNMIIQACKTAGHSVTSAVCAATVVALRLVPGAADVPGHFTAVFPFDMRRHLPAGASIPPVTVCMSGLPFCVDRDGDFDGLFGAYSTFFKSGLTQVGTPGSAPGPEMFSMVRPFLGQVTPLMTTAPGPESEFGNSLPNMNSLGDVGLHITNEREISGGLKLVVDDFWLGTEVLDREVRVYLWTYNGRLTLSLCWNKNFYEPAVMDAYLASIRDVLISNLLGDC